MNRSEHTRVILPESVEWEVASTVKVFSCQQRVNPIDFNTFEDEIGC